MHKNICAIFGEGAVTEHVKSGLQSFVLEISDWTMNIPQLSSPVEVDSNQIKTLLENNQCYTMQEIGNRTQNTQINKVIDENEKCIFYFVGKN